MTYLFPMDVSCGKVGCIVGIRPDSYFIRNRTSYPKLPLNFFSKQVTLGVNTEVRSRRSRNSLIREIYLNNNILSRKINRMENSMKLFDV